MPTIFSNLRRCGSRSIGEAENVCHNTCTSVSLVSAKNNYLVALTGNRRTKVIVRICLHTVCKILVLNDLTVDYTFALNNDLILKKTDSINMT